MRNKKFFNAAALMAVTLLALVFGLVIGCSGVNISELATAGKAGIAFPTGTSVGMPINQIAAWLGDQPANTPATPYTVSVDDDVNISVNNNWAAINTAVASAQADGKYVIIDISACSATGNAIAGNIEPTGNDMNIIYNNPYMGVSFCRTVW